MSACEQGSSVRKKNKTQKKERTLVPNEPTDPENLDEKQEKEQEGGHEQEAKEGEGGDPIAEYTSGTSSGLTI